MTRVRATTRPLRTMRTYGSDFPPAAAYQYIFHRPKCAYITCQALDILQVDSLLDVDANDTDRWPEVVRRVDRSSHRDRFESSRHSDSAAGTTG